MLGEGKVDPIPDTGQLFPTMIWDSRCYDFKLVGKKKRGKIFTALNHTLWQWAVKPLSDMTGRDTFEVECAHFARSSMPRAFAGADLVGARAFLAVEQRKRSNRALFLDVAG